MSNESQIDVNNDMEDNDLFDAEGGGIDNDDNGSAVSSSLDMHSAKAVTRTPRRRKRGKKKIKLTPI